jgi:hypothetical protein
VDGGVGWDLRDFAPQFQRFTTFDHAEKTFDPAEKRKRKYRIYLTNLAIFGHFTATAMQK